LANTPTVPLRLRSPFNGEAWPVPPDSTPEFVAELEKRGFTRIVPVPVKALQLHTYHGQSYDVGETYDCDDQDVETVEAQGKAVRVAERGAYKTTAVGETRTTDLATPKPKK
jgi:hypothetical protein